MLIFFITPRKSRRRSSDKDTYDKTVENVGFLCMTARITHFKAYLSHSTPFALLNISLEIKWLKTAVNGFYAVGTSSSSDMRGIGASIFGAENRSSSAFLRSPSI